MRRRTAREGAGGPASARPAARRPDATAFEPAARPRPPWIRDRRDRCCLRVSPPGSDSGWNGGRRRVGDSRRFPAGFLPGSDRLSLPRKMQRSTVRTAPTSSSVASSDGSVIEHPEAEGDEGHQPRRRPDAAPGEPSGHPAPARHRGAESRPRSQKARAAPDAVHLRGSARGRDSSEGWRSRQGTSSPARTSGAVERMSTVSVRSTWRPV